ncbi:MAG: biopolymer transporter ExbD [Ginsengibacter sp.]
MAQIENALNRNSKSFIHRVNIQMDLTPMVDLGFLLITFFILTTTLSKPKSTNLLMPKDSAIRTILKESSVLTIMPVRNDVIDYFEGRNNESAKIKHCSYLELRSIIQQKQNEVARVLGNKNKTVIIIDPGPQSSYKNFIDILDEIQINDIRHYFVVNHNL